jgi:hypothetical protein
MVGAPLARAGERQSWTRLGTVVMALSPLGVDWSLTFVYFELDHQTWSLHPATSHPATLPPQLIQHNRRHHEGRPAPGVMAQ